MRLDPLAMLTASESYLLGITSMKHYYFTTLGLAQGRVLHRIGLTLEYVVINNALRPYEDTMPLLSGITNYFVDRTDCQYLSFWLRVMGKEFGFNKDFMRSKYGLLFRDENIQHICLIINYYLFPPDADAYDILIRSEKIAFKLTEWLSTASDWEKVQRRNEWKNFSLETRNVVEYFSDLVRFKFDPRYVGLIMRDRY